jgi:pimeloyl-ACP methyl ester carboxylesterase
VPRLAHQAAHLLDVLGIPEADVLGVSFGGAVAQQLALDNPQRVRRLVLASTSVGLGGVPGDCSRTRCSRHRCATTPRSFAAPRGCCTARSTRTATVTCYKRM